MLYINFILHAVSFRLNLTLSLSHCSFLFNFDFSSFSSWFFSPYTLLLAGCPSLSLVFILFISVLVFVVTNKFREFHTNAISHTLFRVHFFLGVINYCVRCAREHSYFSVNAIDDNSTKLLIIYWSNFPLFQV